jgi:hypothetical protein
MERTGRGGYQVGLRLWEVGALAPRGHGLRETAMPFLEDLYEATRQNVQLAVLDGTEVVYVERIASRHAVAVVTRPGSRLPLHATGVGLVLLAFSDPALQERVLATPLRRFTPKTIARRPSCPGARRDPPAPGRGQRRADHPGRAVRGGADRRPGRDGERRAVGGGARRAPGPGVRAGGVGGRPGHLPGTGLAARARGPARPAVRTGRVAGSGPSDLGGAPGGAVRSDLDPFSDGFLTESLRRARRPA